MRLGKGLMGWTKQIMRTKWIGLLIKGGCVWTMHSKTRKLPFFPLSVSCHPFLALISFPSLRCEMRLNRVLGLVGLALVSSAGLVTAAPYGGKNLLAKRATANCDAAQLPTLNAGLMEAKAMVKKKYC